MEILTTALYILACVLLFSLAIAIHEFGHFIVALKLGLKVEAFSIGFGPALWKKVVGGVEYRIGAIPFGGYVMLPDIDPEGTKMLEGGGSAKSAGRIPPWKELAVAVAGPAMNLVLAAAIAVALSLAPGARFGELPSVIGRVPGEGPAFEAGLRPGDKVVSVGGRAVSTWVEMQTEVQISGGRATEFVVSRPGAAGAGPETLALPVTPVRDKVTGVYFIMAYSVTNATGAVGWMPARNPLKQLAWDAGSIFRVLKGLVTPREAAATASAVGGPVMIAEGIYRSLRHNPLDGIGFMRFLNVNLAILNLLPIPVLDGGLILFALIAMVFRRRLPARLVKWLSTGFMYLLIALMAVLLFKDSMRSWKIHTYNAAAEKAADKADKEDVPAQTDTER